MKKMNEYLHPRIFYSDEKYSKVRYERIKYTIFEYLLWIVIHFFNNSVYLSNG